MIKSKLNIETIPVEKIIPYAGNAKLHPDWQIDQIAASIKRFGFNDPIGVDPDNVIIEGHGRFYAAKKLGMNELPAIRLGHLSDAEKKAYILAHNKLTMNTGFDIEKLQAEIECIQELDIELSLVEIGVIDGAGVTLPAPESQKFEAILQVIVTCETEKEQELAYKLLVENGYKVKMVSL